MKFSTFNFQFSIRPAVRGFSFLFLLVLIGCAWVGQTVTLRPAPNVPVSGPGLGAAVAVRVTDRRTTRVLGYRGLDSHQAEITTRQDMPRLVRGEILAGLLRQGFTADPGDAPARVLHVEILALEYTTAMDFWKGSVRTRAVLRVRASRGGPPFERTYEGVREEKTFEAPRAKTNARLLNGALSDALERLLTDDRLRVFLAG